MAEAQVIRIKPHHYIHVLDQTNNVTRVCVGPMTFTRQEQERVVSGPNQMIMIPPRHYCIIQNPAFRYVSSCSFIPNSFFSLATKKETLLLTKTVKSKSNMEMKRFVVNATHSHCSLAKFFMGRFLHSKLFFQTPLFVYEQPEMLLSMMLQDLPETNGSLEGNLFFSSFSGFDHNFLDLELMFHVLKFKLLKSFVLAS